MNSVAKLGFLIVMSLLPIGFAGAAETAKPAAAPIAAAARGDAPVSPEANAALEVELTSIFQTQHAAMLKRDTDAMGKLFAEQALISAQGRFITKAEFLQGLKKLPPDAVTSSTVTFADTRVAVTGDTAVLTTRASVKETVGGKDQAAELLISRTHVRQAGRWVVLTHHVAPATK